MSETNCSGVGCPKCNPKCPEKKDKTPTKDTSTALNSIYKGGGCE